MTTPRPAAPSTSRSEETASLDEAGASAIQTQQIQREGARLAELYALEILDTPEEPQFDRIMFLVAQYFRVPYGSVTFIDADRQWFKSWLGFTEREAPRSASICSLTIAQQGVLVIGDTRSDPRLAELREASGEPALQFYAGAPIVTDGRQAVGAICILDPQPRSFTPADAEVLSQFAQLITSELRLRRLTQQLAAQALTDELTGLPNRRALRRRLERVCTPGTTDRPQETVLGMLDLDDFKGINDRLGHAVGDDTLGFLARQGQSLLRPGETLARHGGDEFVLLLSGEGSLARGTEIALALPGLLQTGAPVEGLKVSIGLVQARGAVSPDALLRAADWAMYRAKRQGSLQVARLDEGAPEIQATPPPPR